MGNLKAAMVDTTRATFVVPPDEVSRQKCLAVEEIASDWLKKECSIYYKRDYSINTIATVYLEQMFGLLAMIVKRNPTDPDGQMVTLNGIIDAISSVKNDEDAEKEGNINLRIQFGGRYYYPEDMSRDLQVLRTGDKDQKYRVVLPPDDLPGETETMKIINDLTQRMLQKKFHLLVMQPFMCSTCASAFLTAVIQWAVDTCQETGKPVLYNISDIIECRCVMKGKDPVIHFVPGEGAKLALKYDEYTEEE